MIKVPTSEQWSDLIGKVRDVYTKSEIDTMVGNLDALLNRLNSGEGVA